MPWPSSTLARDRTTRPVRRRRARSPRVWPSAAPGPGSRTAVRGCAPTAARPGEQGHRGEDLCGLRASAGRTLESQAPRLLRDGRLDLEFFAAAVTLVFVGHVRSP